MALYNISQLQSGSINDASLGFVGDSVGDLYQTSYRAMKNYFQQGITGSGGSGGQSNLLLGTTISGSVNLSSSYTVVAINATSGNVTATLPSASIAYGAGSGSVYYPIRMDLSSNTVIISASAGDFINGQPGIIMSSQYGAHMIVCLGNNTWVMLF